MSPVLDLNARIFAPAAAAPGASETGARSFERLEYRFEFRFWRRRHGPLMTWYESLMTGALTTVVKASVSPSRVRDRGEDAYDPDVSLSIVDRGDGLSGAISGVLTVACKFDGGLDNRHEGYNNIVISTHGIDQRNFNKTYLHRPQ